MAAEGVLSAAERQAEIDRRLDEIDRALLGLLPRSERLAMIATVEMRLEALGNDLPITAAARNVAMELGSGAASSLGNRRGARRSRLAFTAGVLGIIAVAALVVSPILFIGLTFVAEVVGETAAIALMGLFTALLLLGGGYAVCGGGASLFRLAGRGQTKTGMGWAITGLCTGALPVLIGLVSVIALGGQLLESQSVEVTISASPGEPVPGQIYAQPVFYPQAPIMPSPAGALPPCNMPTQLPAPLPPEARTASQPPMLAPAKAAPAAKPAAATKHAPAAEPESEALLPAAPPVVKDEEVEAED